MQLTLRELVEEDLADRLVAPDYLGQSIFDLYSCPRDEDAPPHRVVVMRDPEHWAQVAAGRVWVEVDGEEASALVWSFLSDRGRRIGEVVFTEEAREVDYVIHCADGGYRIASPVIVSAAGAA